MTTKRITLADALELDDAAGVRLTSDGYMVASPRIARTGIQIYKGREIGRPDLGDVRVYRSEEVVFSEDSLRSYGHRPVTIEHPPQRVTAKNWKKYSVGQTGDEVVRDGKFIRIPMVLMDAEAIERVRTGKDQLSVGYSADIEWGRGVTDSGEEYDALQSNITANHLAVVAAARGGSELHIGDDTDEGDRNMTTRTIIVDGISLEMTDTAAAVVQRALQVTTDALGVASKKLTDSETALGAARAQLTTDAAAHVKAVETKDGEIVALKKQLKDAEVTPQILDQRVAQRLDVVDKARAVLGDKFATDGKTDVEIRRAVVASKLGDSAAKDMSDAAIDGAFAAFTVGAKNGTDRLARSLSDGRPASHSSQEARDAAYAKSVDDQTNAWKNLKVVA